MGLSGISIADTFQFFLGNGRLHCACLFYFIDSRSEWNLWIKRKLPAFILILFLISIILHERFFQ